MNPLRKNHVTSFRRQDDCVVDYADEVTDDQVERANEVVRPEFEQGDWVIIEEES